MLRMRFFSAGFFRQEEGAVSGELVVLTAACVALAVALIGSIRSESGALGDQIGLAVARAEVRTPSAAGGD